MGETSKIQWTDATWNIARGCTKVDADCKYCYMYRDGARFKYDAKQVIRTKQVFKMPLRLKEPSRIFTSSLTDVFHREIDSYRNEMWDIIRRCPQHTFQILTKRPERITECLPADWGDGWDNVWLGTSVGSKKGIPRIIELLKVKTKVRFISVEPLYSPFNFRWKYVPENWRAKQSVVTQFEILREIDWVIVGGESGNKTGKYKYRPCKLKWIQTIVNNCKEAKVNVFVKQLGTHLASEMGLNDRHGGDMEEWPEELRVREFPISKLSQIYEPSK